MDLAAIAFVFQRHPEVEFVFEQLCISCFKTREPPLLTVFKVFEKHEFQCCAKQHCAVTSLALHSSRICLCRTRDLPVLH